MTKNDEIYWTELDIRRLFVDEVRAILKHEETAKISRITEALERHDRLIKPR